ncbi:hypothetical protein F0562_024744 [Nyssa sinensis]|uniref:Acid phosphatase n=1 Tax=Nyssa sinensis TaxID=561372 RepID=A0A5J5BF67_9ASTE|nr:hypothetical protein F0562_024744 [Nyssa sinensis]
MGGIALFFFLATIVATSHAEEIPQQIHLIRPYSGAAGNKIPGLSCLSWRLAVETDNIRDWLVVPEKCEDYVGHYMLGKQYRKDCDTVAYAAIEYAESVKLAGDGKDIWVFDIDETTLSNLPYYARPQVAFGAKAYNSTAFNEWVAEARAPPIPGSLMLYNRLVSQGFKIVFLTGSGESVRQARITNLKKVGYHTWEKLILKKNSESSTTSVVYKSRKRAELEAAGYRIIGNMGDQWSDLLGTNVGNRTFKVPDPIAEVGDGGRDGKRWKHSMILVRLEKDGVALYRAEHFAAAGKAKLPVELAGIVEAEDVFGLLGEEIFGFGEEFEGVALDDVFEVGEAAGFVLDEFGSGA